MEVEIEGEVEIDGEEEIAVEQESQKQQESPLPKRLQQDLDEFEEIQLASVRDFKPSRDRNPFHFTALIIPDLPPYNKGTFRVKFYFSHSYPYTPPKIVFKTRIYHPNIDESGRVALDLLWARNWKHTNTVLDVLQALIMLIQKPDLENAICVDAANEYIKDRKRYMKVADAYTRKFSEPRSMGLLTFR